MDAGLQLCTGGGDQNHPQEKAMQQFKVVSEDALQIAEKRGENTRLLIQIQHWERERTVRLDTQHSDFSDYYITPPPHQNQTYTLMYF